MVCSMLKGRGRSEAYKKAPPTDIELQFHADSSDLEDKID